MKKEKSLHIIQLNIVMDRYHTGIDRYLEMYMREMETNCSYRNIRVHTLFLTDHGSKGIFPNIQFDDKGQMRASFPLPMDRNLFVGSSYWKVKFAGVVAEMLTPYLNGFDPIIFQFHNLFLLELAAVLKKKFGGKILMHLHGLPWKYSYNENIELFKKLYQLYQDRQFSEFKKQENAQMNYHVPDAIVCLSEVAKQYVMQVHGGDENDIRVIRNGLPLNLSVPVVERSHNRTEILYVGKISPDKGILNLLEAMKVVKEKGYDFVLYMAGSCSWEFRHLIQSRYKSIDFQLLGQISFNELQKLYASCTIGVVPSLFEQCSYVAIEMAMHGVPMVVSDVDALSEMFMDEETALLVPLVFDEDLGLCADRELFAGQIIRLICDRDLRERLGKCAQTEFRTHFNLDFMLKETVNMYRQLVNN